MSSFDRIQLVVLSYNRFDCLPGLFNDLLLPAAGRGVHVTVVDNASEQGLQQYLAGFSGTPNLETIQLRRNSGVARGRNQAFRGSRREIVVYLDDDAFMTLEALERVPTTFDELPEAGILAFQVVHGKSGECQNDHGNRRTSVGNFHGAGHAIRRTVFDRVGYLDESCFFGAEEVEFSMRALCGGFKTIYTPEIQVRHFTFRRAGGDLLRRRIYWAQNYAMVLFRYLPAGTATLFSFRLLTSYSLWGLHVIKFGVVLLPPAMLIGALKGLLSHNRLGPDGVAFYSDPATKPEIGNVSLLSKATHRLHRTTSAIK